MATSTRTGTKNWADVRTERRRRRPVNEARVKQYESELIAENRAYRLRELRDELGVTQKQIAEIAGVTQARVSSIEKGDLDRTQLGTLLAYVLALGAHIDVTVTIGDERRVLYSR